MYIAHTYITCIYAYIVYTYSSYIDSTLRAVCVAVVAAHGHPVIAFRIMVMECGCLL